MPEARPRPAAGLLLAGGGILALLSQTLVQSLPAERRAWGLGLAAIGLLFFLSGVWIIQRGGAPESLGRLAVKLGGWLGVRNWQAILLAVSLPLAVTVPLAAGDGAAMHSPWTAVTAWLLAVGAVIAGGWQGVTPRPRLRLGILFSLLLLTGLAFLPRGLATRSIPILLTGDEGSAGLAAAALLRGETNNLFATLWYSFPSLYFGIPALSIAILGRTTEALRLPSALAGALTVAAAYYAGRAMFGRRAGLLAAIFLAAFSFHIHFSRIGLNNIWDGLWYTVTAGALWYGWQRERRNAWLLAGLGLGLAQYFYPSARTLLAVAFLWLLIAGLFDRARLKRALPHILLFLFTAAIVLLPLAWYFAGHPNEYLAPLGRVSLFGDWLYTQIANTGLPAWKIMLQQISLGFQAFFYTPVRFWYAPGVPLLRPAAAAIFLLGLALLLARPRDSRSQLLLFWLIAFGLIGGLSESTPAAQRYVAVAPACALVIGCGLDRSASLLAKAWPGRARLFAALAFLIMLAAAYGELRFYFGEYTPNSVLIQAHSNGMVAQRLADHLQNQPAGTQVVFFGAPFMGFYSIPSIQYLAPEIAGIDINQPWGAPENPRPGGSRLLFIFLPQNAEQIPPVQADYPGGELSYQPAADGQALYWQYEYP